MPAGKGAAPAGVPESFAEHVRLMFDLQLLAFTSDITRIFAFKLSRDGSNRAYTESGFAGAFHPASHHGNVAQRILEFAKLNTWHVGQLTYFLEKLKATPDGEGIAFETRINSQFDIWKIRPTGGPSIPVVSHPRSDEHPSWSPDGRLIAFSSTRYGRPDVYVAAGVGESRDLPARRITNRGDNTHPAWGPRRTR